MCIIDNLLSSAAEDAGALKEIRPSSAAWAHYQESCDRSRPYTDTGPEGCMLPHLEVSSQRTTSTHIVTGQVPEDVQWSGSPRALVSVTENRQGKIKAPLAEMSLASAGTDCHSARRSSTLAKSFCQGLGFGEQCGSILLQSDPSSHSVLEYFSGNEITTHKEAKC